VARSTTPKRSVGLLLVLGGLVLAALVAGLAVASRSGGKGDGAAAPTTTAAAPTTTVATPAGKAVFAERCAVCHGDHGQGGVGPALVGANLRKTFPDKRVQVIVVTSGSGRMPAFGSTLTPAEIAAVVDYTRTLGG
jgi:mono/diheme cytochrome c family protein